MARFMVLKHDSSHEICIFKMLPLHLVAYGDVYKSDVAHRVSEL